MEDLYKSNYKIIENHLQNNKELLALIKIFDLIEENQQFKNREIKDQKIFNDKISIKTNSNILNVIHDINNRPKNKYKLKLQKVIKTKKISN